MKKKWRAVGRWEGISEIGIPNQRIQQEYEDDLAEARVFSEAFNKKYGETLRALARYDKEES